MIVQIKRLKTGLELNLRTKTSPELVWMQTSSKARMITSYSVQCTFIAQIHTLGNRVAAGRHDAFSYNKKLFKSYWEH